MIVDDFFSFRSMDLPLTQLPLYLLRGLQHLSRSKCRFTANHSIEKAVFRLKPPWLSFNK